MQDFNIIVKSEVEESFRVLSVKGMFDLEDLELKEQFQGSLFIEDDWSIGLIVGASGTGKTTIAREALGVNADNKNLYTKNSVVDDMPKANIKDICKTFVSVGFSSPRSWLKPYSVLSNGEKMRVDLAYALLSEDKIIVFDEYTSVVDRQVAKTCSLATQKSIRASSKKFIAISCHYDLEEYLMPDWVFDTNSMKMKYTKRKYLRQPRIELKVYEVRKCDKLRIWNFFKKHHYLSSKLSLGAKCFVFIINNNLCGFSSAVHFPHHKVSNFKKGHRTVVLPDFQGIGIGSTISNFTANYFLSLGFRYLSTTSSPALNSHRKKSKLWKLKSVNTPAKTRSVSNLNMIGKNRGSKLSVSWEYIESNRGIK